ncbi:MAG: hypothetical protein IBJ10_03860 [Phycisphaerales bacterium]|nr:hypothetical protein [Phycisphaerales bacterium]
MSLQPNNSLMRSLGAFWGHVKLGATRRIEPGARRVEVSRQTAERPAEPGEVPGLDAAGSVTLRRTVIEEIEVRPAPTEASPDRPGPG